MTRTDVALRLLLYALLQALFARLGFGVAFFAVAALYAMFATASEQQRKKGELSAYSVFNKDCRSIEGSISPEDFEREMRCVRAAAALGAAGVGLWDGMCVLSGIACCMVVACACSVERSQLALMPSNVCTRALACFPRYGPGAMRKNK